MKKIFNKYTFILLLLFVLTSSFGRQPFLWESYIETIQLPITEDVIALRERLDDIFAEYRNGRFDYGMKVISLHIPQTLYEVNHETPFAPASNLKVITTAAGFHFFTPDYLWATDFYLNSFGDLYIRGSGDPTWNERYRRTRINALFKTIADSLAHRNITSVRNVIVERGTFNDFQMENSWRPENRLAAYSAKPSIIGFNDNTVQIQINPTTVGSHARISFSPVDAGFVLLNNVITTDNRRAQNFSYHPDTLSNAITINGAIWRGSQTAYRTIATPRPDLYALDIIRHKFTEFAINTTGLIYYDSIPERELNSRRYEKLFSLETYRLAQTSNDINKFSNNFNSNQLFLAIGERHGHAWQSENAIKEWLSNNHIPVEGLQMYDGSGLSPLNRCSPDIFVYVLKLMYQKVYFEEFKKTMAIAGVDGTLRRQLTSPQLKGNVFAKTGYIAGVRGLTGYMHTADGELVAFSLLVNRYHGNVAAFYEMTEKLLMEIYNFSRERYWDGES
jgi:D-alanyl-D-alanine carboxypeptidase/D-alanyl-D-alanine-endopeptidase (penicillin-binding protein 4)